MNASLSMAVADTDTVAAAVRPSLQDSDAATFTVDAGEELQVDVTADTFGVLRGTVNTAMMLTRLSHKILER